MMRTTGYVGTGGGCPSAPRHQVEGLPGSSGPLLDQARRNPHVGGEAPDGPAAEFESDPDRRVHHRRRLPASAQVRASGLDLSECFEGVPCVFGQFRVRRVRRFVAALPLEEWACFRREPFQTGRLRPGVVNQRNARG